MSESNSTPAQSSQPGSYRDRIYGRYATVFKDMSSTFDEAGARRNATVYRHYLRGWLPASKDSVVGDLACGDGKILYLFKQEGYQNVHGVDISPEMAALARQVVPDVAEESVLTYLRDKQNTFDLLTAFDLVEHLTRDELLDFLDAVHGALKPGGRFVIQTPNADNPMFGVIRYGDFTHEVCLNTNSLTRLLALCGFEKAEARECGPVPVGLKGTLRRIAWKILRLGVWVWNTVETGSPGTRVYTRVFMASAVKPAK